MRSVLHISAWDNFGGSGRSAHRVHVGLKRLGVRSRMLVGWKAMEREADGDIELLGGRLRFADQFFNRVTDRLSLQYLAAPSSALLPYRRWVREADVIQLYNAHGGYFSHTVLPVLSRRRPVVWRLSDMWPMTGHCTYSFECERWKTGCGSCPILSDYPALRRDRTALLWRVKQRLYRRSRLTIVSPSRWMAGLARQSPLLREFPQHVIPNGLDTEVFHPIAKSVAREALGVQPNRRVVLFGAHFISERRKGGQWLTQALERLRQEGRSDIELLVMGRTLEPDATSLRFPMRDLGPIRDDRLLATVYSAADVFILPTLADNLPNGILESMACGTPVVSCNVGGVPELVRHLDTGYLARPRDADDLAKGIQLLLDDPDVREAMGRRGREIVEREHTLELQAKRFLALYEEAAALHRAEAHSV